MGQLFKLFNLDNSVHVSSCVGGKFGEFYFTPMPNTEVLSALWSPNENEKRVSVLPLNEAEGLSFPKKSNENLSKGPMSQLPNEVIGIIMRKVLDFSDLISLMVTCQRYWESGRRHLERLLEDSIVVSWAGDRLICLGNAEIDNLPERMLTDSEVERLELLYDHEIESLWDALLRFPRPRSLRPIRSRNSTAHSVFDLYYRLYESRGGRWHQYYETRDVLKRLILITDLDPADFFSGCMVLRNLTTKEYVRGDAITKARDMPDKPWLKGMGFEHVLYIRTTWSSDPSLGCIYDGSLQIHRGVWAGHRFDVTYIGSVEDKEGVAVDSWKDVTKEVINEVMEIWEPEGLYELNL